MLILDRSVLGEHDGTFRKPNLESQISNEIVWRVNGYANYCFRCELGEKWVNF